MLKFLWSKNKSKHAKLLVVDDAPNIVQTVQNRLEKTNCQAIVVYDGKERLQKVITQKPNISISKSNRWLTVNSVKQEFGKFGRNILSRTDKRYSIRGLAKISNYKPAQRKYYFRLIAETRIMKKNI
jgi:hypothetical protein